MINLSHCITGIWAFFDNLNMKTWNVRYDFLLDRGHTENILRLKPKEKIRLEKNPSTARV